MPRKAAEAASTGPKVPSVVQAIRILRYLAEHPTPLGVNALARTLEMNPSSCFNILKTLTSENFLSFDAISKSYSIGPAAIMLARRSLDPNQAFEIARPEILRLANKFSATCLFWRVEQDERMTLVGFVEGGAHFNLHLTIGQRLPSSIGAAGRCIVASMNLTPEKLRSSFDKLLWQAAPQFEDYLKDIENARKQGWACDVGAYISGVTTIASAISDHYGSAQYVLCTVLPKDKAPPKSRPQIGSATKKAAEVISDKIFGSFS